MLTQAVDTYGVSSPFAGTTQTTETRRAEPLKDVTSVRDDLPANTNLLANRASDKDVETALTPEYLAPNAAMNPRTLVRYPPQTSPDNVEHHCFVSHHDWLLWTPRKKRLRAKMSYDGFAAKQKDMWCTARGQQVTEPRRPLKRRSAFCRRSLDCLRLVGNSVWKADQAYHLQMLL